MPAPEPKRASGPINTETALREALATIAAALTGPAEPYTPQEWREWRENVLPMRAIFVRGAAEAIAPAEDAELIGAFVRNLRREIAAQS